MQNTNADLLLTTFLQGGNAVYIEQQYARYMADPNSVSEDLRSFFEALGDPKQYVEGAAKGASWKKAHWPQPEGGELVSALDGNWAEVEKKVSDKLAKKAPTASAEDIRKATTDSVMALMLIRAYRIRGHMKANLDPLGLVQPKSHPDIDIETYGFTSKDFDRKIFIGGELGLEEATLKQILDILHSSYCETLAIEYMHIYSLEQRNWIQRKVEKEGRKAFVTPELRSMILDRMVAAEGFEKFLHTKYMGTKRFGLDGGEALIPALEQIIVKGNQLGVEEVVFGMPHRGRLNVLANTLGKPYRAILNEFQGGSPNPEDFQGSGDVKYHLGASMKRKLPDGKEVHLSLVANPSHLETVDPVVLGKVRAKQERYNDDRHKVLPILLHGDAAFAGQGVVAECFALSGLKGYSTGGTVHVVVNNQIGFTTSPQYSRTSAYPSDVAKMVQAPIFHVNGDDPEAVVFAANLAIEFRQEFQKDVVLDIFCYRRFGHNEGDEPSFTQPLMYKKIKGQRTSLDLYRDWLASSGLISKEDSQKKIDEMNQRLSEDFEAAKSYKPNKADWLDGKWAKMTPSACSYQDDPVGKTAVSDAKLQEVGKALTTVPTTFSLHKTITRTLDAKKEMFATGKNIDWATAEALAFGTLVDEGIRVRLSGQDCGRGTFSQRHARLRDQETGDPYAPINHIRDGQARFEVIDSLLSEYAVLGFDYGFSWETPDSLVLWEAQFGDFANGAQIMIDQFISSAETKWLRMSGLVLLLPHGYEGQGPEHSSARLERYLQLCAEDNMQVANCSTPANYFHILRRQICRSFRKPLVIMTPKSLLRHKLCVSDLADLADGSTFQMVLPDHGDVKGSGFDILPDNQIKKVVLCSGKVYYDLLEERQNRGIKDTYLLRIEQLYPFPMKEVIASLKRFTAVKDIVWCQEEPRNMGAWSFVEEYIEEALKQSDSSVSRPVYVGRKASASTATGSASRHKAELQAIFDKVFSA